MWERAFREKVANICKGEGKGWHRIQAHAKEG
jgi:hypothetical protein